MTTTKLQVQATLEIDSRGSEVVDAWSVEELQGKIWEVKELALPVSFEIGRTRISGTLRFLVPTPIEMKSASLQI